MKLFIRLLITAIAVAAAIWIVPGINIVGSSAWLAVLVTALVLAFLDAWVKPLLEFLSCGAVLITFGLFLLVINAVVLLFAAQISSGVFGVGFTIDGFWPAFWGGIIISIVTWLLNVFVVDE